MRPLDEGGGVDEVRTMRGRFTNITVFHAWVECRDNDENVKLQWCATVEIGDIGRSRSASVGTDARNCHVGSERIIWLHGSLYCCGLKGSAVVASGTGKVDDRDVRCDLGASLISDEEAKCKVDTSTQTPRLFEPVHCFVTGLCSLCF